jgi:hypothetical protein
MLQLQEDQPLHQGLPHGQAGQLTESHGTSGEPTARLAEGSNIVDWPHQLHHHGGHPHRSGSTRGYVLPP